MIKPLSAFDVIGPRMIGPSSSHTAGALRIALLARKLVRGEIKAVDFKLYGSFAQTYRGHGTDRALTAGILGFEADDPRVRDSLELAKEKGIDVMFSPDPEMMDIVHPNTVDIVITNDEGERITIRGVSRGGGAAELRAVDGVEIKLTGNYSTVFTQQIDRPGVLAHIASAFSDHNINIAFMRLYRENKGERAFTIVEADEEITPDVLAAIENHPSVRSAILIQ